VDLADCRIDTTAGTHGLLIPGWGGALPEAALVRGIAGGSFEQVTKRLAVLHLLERLGVPVYNRGRAIERSVDKATTSALLHAAGVPTPPAWALEDESVAQRLLMRESAAGHALVLKPVFGSQGKGLRQVGWVRDAAHPDGHPVALPPPAEVQGLYYLQRLVPPAGSPGEPGFDWRVLVVGGRARAAMQRVSRHGFHLVAQGARCVAAPLTEALAGTAEAAAASLGLDYAGVDLIPSPRGPQVLEVNGVAAWRGLQKVTPFNIAEALVADLLDRVVPQRARPLARQA
jgi:RimK family alpha-L-glutamate ligase